MQEEKRTYQGQIKISRSDNTLYSCNKNLKHVFSNLKYDLRNVLHWFKINSMKTNPGKFQFMVLGVKKI